MSLGGFRYFARLAPAVCVYAADRLSKLLAEQWLSVGEVWPLLPGCNLTLLYNSGAAFGFLADRAGGQRWFLIGVSLLVSVVLLIWLWRLPPARRWLGFAMSLILGGALGNLHDRLQSGTVVDFIDLYYRHWHWPAFNLADMAICGGALLYAGLLLRADARA